MLTTLSVFFKKNVKVIFLIIGIFIISAGSIFYAKESESKTSKTVQFLEEAEDRLWVKGYLTLTATSTTYNMNYKITTDGGGINAQTDEPSVAAGYFSNSNPSGYGLIVNKGNVGIGTTTPSTSLQVYGTTTIMNGNVGIGITTPNRTLHVYKDAGDNAEIDIQSVAGPNKHWGIYQDRATEDLRFWNDTVPGDKNALTITKNGNVGIGTSTPTANLEVRGEILSNGGHAFGGAYLRSSGCDSTGEEGSCAKVNPITNGCTCPTGYTSFYSAHGDGKGDWGCTNLVICVK